MVSSKSAICLVLEYSNQIAVSADHSKIVKFRARADPIYQRVCYKITEMIDTCKFRSTTFSSAKLVTQGKSTSTQRFFVVPFPKNEEYIVKSQIRTFVEENSQGRDTRSVYVTVALCGLGGTGQVDYAVPGYYQSLTSISGLEKDPGCTRFCILVRVAEYLLDPLRKHSEIRRTTGSWQSSSISLDL